MTIFPRNVFKEICFSKFFMSKLFHPTSKKTCLYNSNVQQNQQSKSLNHSTVLMNRNTCSIKVHNQTGC